MRRANGFPRGLLRSILRRMSASNANRWIAKLAAMDTNLLVALDALLQESNVTRAATRLGVTQSAMSQTLARIRDHFDDPILVRVGRAMQPTPFARRLQDRLHQAISDLEGVVRERPQFDPTQTSRRFVLTMVDYVALLFVAPFQRAVSEVAPHIDLAVHSLEAEAMTPKLEAGAIDLYVGIHGETESGMKSKTLFRETFSVLVRKKHPLAKKKLTPQSYVSHPHVHVSPRRERGSVVSRALAELGLERRVAVEVPYFSLVPALLRESDLIATVPTQLAVRLAKDHGLSVLPPPVKLPEFDMCMAWHPRFEREPGLLWLRGLLSTVADELIM